MTSSRNSLMADVLDEIADVLDHKPAGDDSAPHLRARARALRSTPERANLADALIAGQREAEQPAGGLRLYTQHHVIPDFSFTYERSHEAEAVIDAIRGARRALVDDGYGYIVTMLDALDRKHRGVT
jgi:hypothetical protein